jgi:hypothetical protein
MKADRTTKVLLALIALGLWLNALAPMFRTPRVVRAADKLTCKGELKANAWGGTSATIGGYDVDVTCRE